MQRKRFNLQGIVQGVGLRPFVFNLAKALHLTGWIGNTNDGAAIEVQGDAEAVNLFRKDLVRLKPKNALFASILEQNLPLKAEPGFSIKESETTQSPAPFILPDLSICDACFKEMLTPGNRRYRYPFINCVDCGPRFSIIEKLPYDRAHTTMKDFKLCEDCRREYNDTNDRRFHAEPIACPVCGPELALWDPKGGVLAKKDEALKLACSFVKSGAILAFKGVGGFQLIVDAANATSIQKLRERKKRKDKPFALMYLNLEKVQEHAFVSKTEENLLRSLKAPIVLLKAKSPPAPNISPQNPYLGVMLPASALHMLFMQEFNSCVVATSGNRSEEPICREEYEALHCLQGIADYFLVHNRPIKRAIDDSVVHVVAGKQQMLRRARGYASIPLSTHLSFPPSLAVGGHLKNTVAVGKGNLIYLSQHIGDLGTEKAAKTFQKEINTLLDFFQIDPEVVVSDCHPDYASTQFAQDFKKRPITFQHHAAHVYSCMAEHQAKPPLLGVSWDGTGWGLDGSIWGGEFIVVNADYSWKREATFKPFRIPGSKRAIREPHLSLIGLLYEMHGGNLFAEKKFDVVASLPSFDRHNLSRILASGYQCPLSTSVGRIFDAVSALLLPHINVTFEGQAAMALEFISEKSSATAYYPFHVMEKNNEPAVIDWIPMLQAILQELHDKIPAEDIGKKFHNTLAEMIVAMAKGFKIPTVLLTGGVFQNRLLTKSAIKALSNAHFTPLWHQEIPPNDGGLALGQLYSLISLRHKGKSANVPLSRLG